MVAAPVHLAWMPYGCVVGAKCTRGVGYSASCYPPYGIYIAEDENVPSSLALLDRSHLHSVAGAVHTVLRCSRSVAVTSSDHHLAHLVKLNEVVL